MQRDDARNKGVKHKREQSDARPDHSLDRRAGASATRVPPRMAVSVTLTRPLDAFCNRALCLTHDMHLASAPREQGAPDGIGA